MPHFKFKSMPTAFYKLELIYYIALNSIFKSQQFSIKSLILNLHLIEQLFLLQTNCLFMLLSLVPYSSWEHSAFSTWLAILFKNPGNNRSNSTKCSKTQKRTMIRLQKVTKCVIWSDQYTDVAFDKKCIVWNTIRK